MLMHAPESVYAVIDTGITKQSGALLRERLGGRNILLAADAVTHHLFAAAVASALREAGYDVAHFVAPLGEDQKTLHMANSLASRMITSKIDDGDIVLAAGGGAIADLAAYAVSISAPRAHFVQMPTTLVAQAHPMTTGRAWLNADGFKDVLSARSIPSAIIIDPAVLATLSRDRLEEGVAEHIRLSALTREDGLDAFLTTPHEVLCGDVLRLALDADAMRRSLAENGEAGEAALSLGGVFAGALEAATGFDTSYGKAIGMGMLLLTRYTEAQGLTEAGTTLRIRDALTSQGLPVRPRTRPDSDTMMGALIRASGDDGVVETAYLKRIGAYGMARIPLQDLAAVAQHRDMSL